MFGNERNKTLFLTHGVLRSYNLLATELYVQCESKNPPLRFSDIFSQTVGNFWSKFYVPIICSYLR